MSTICTEMNANGEIYRPKTGDVNASFDIRFSFSSVDGEKRYENASVNIELFISFWLTENEGSNEKKKKTEKRKRNTKAHTPEDRNPCLRGPV